MYTRKTVCATCFISVKWWPTNLKRGFTLFVLVFASLDDVKGQVVQTSRYEIPILFNNDKFEIIPAGAHGLYLHRRYTGAREDQIQLIRLDTAFREQWNGFLQVERNYSIIGSKTLGDKLYMLFRYRDYSRNDLLLYVIHQSQGEYSRYTIKGYIPFAPSEFQVTGKAVVIGGYYNRVPVVLHFSLASGLSKVLPGIFNEAGELTQVRTYPDGTFDILISALNFKRQRTIWIKSYDPDGSLLRNFSLDPDDKHLIFGRSLKVDNNMQIVAGVYGTTRSAEFSRGVFIASIDPTGMQQTRYYNFADLENFFKFMKAKREQRIRERIERRKIKGKKIRFNYRFLVHELVPHNNQYILLGEAFYPRYISSTGHTTFFSPYMYPNAIVKDGRIFDGYYYTHAVVMGFDTRGKLLWDNSFEINDVKTYTLDQFVKLEVNRDRIALFYLFDDKIRTKIIKDNQVLEGKSMDPIRTFRANDVVKRENLGSGKLEYWYNGYMYAYGVQEIENNQNARKPARRRVFFINKVTYGD